SFSLCLLFCIRAPPRPPLFPYTTLFRSRASAVGRPPALWLEHLLEEKDGVDVRAADREDPVAVDRPLALVIRRQRSPAITAVAQDRKSTRLNSSHEWISYAVFCLKKKKM